MKKNFNKLLSVVVAASMLTGCAGGGGASQGASAETKEQPVQSETSAAGEASAAADANESSDYYCSDEPIELTAHLHTNNLYVLNDSWYIMDEAARLTNVKLSGTASPMETDSKNAFNLMIASKDIPDIVGGELIDINKYGTEGAFMPLNDLIEQYAPNIKKMLDENPDVKTAITAADGNIYEIPSIYDSEVSQTWFIRQDWLDALNLEAPTTVDELHDVLTAFVNDDPNGNGQKDEVGFFTRLTTAGGGNVLQGILSLFGINEHIHTNAEGKITYGPYTPEYKDAMKNVSEWYAEGLIDKEIFTRGDKARDMLFPENNGGLIHDWYSSTSGYNVSLQETVPGFELKGILPPADINGDQWELDCRSKLTTNGEGRGWAISAKNSYPEETIKYFDFWWTEQGQLLQTYGIEGDTYTIEDGEPVYTQKVLESTDPINVYMAKIGAQNFDIGHVCSSDYEKYMMSEAGAEVLDLYLNSDVVNKKNINLPPLGFTQEETDLIQSKWPMIMTFVAEQTQKWTFDGSNIDAEFDQYMDTLKSMGVEEVLAAYQAAYDRIEK